MIWTNIQGGIPRVGQPRFHAWGSHPISKTPWYTSSSTAGAAAVAGRSSSSQSMMDAGLYSAPCRLSLSEDAMIGAIHG